MKYDVTKLRAATDKAIEQEEALWHKAHDERVSKYQLDLAEWTEKHADAWKAAAQAIGRKLRSGKPVTPEDIPRGRYGDSTTFNAHDVGEFSYSMSSDLAVIRSALQLITDDTVTPTELAKLGVRASELRTVLSLAR